MLTLSFLGVESTNQMPTSAFWMYSILVISPVLLVMISVFHCISFRLEAMKIAANAEKQALGAGAGLGCNGSRCKLHSINPSFTTKPQPSAAAGMFGFPVGPPGSGSGLWCHAVASRLWGSYTMTSAIDLFRLYPFIRWIAPSHHPILESSGFPITLVLAHSQERRILHCLFSRRRFRKRWSLRSSSSETMVSPDAGRRQRRSVSLVVMVVMMKSWDLSDLTWFDQEKLGLEYLWMIDGSLFLLPFGSQRWLGSPLWIYSFRARKIIKEQGGSSIAMFEKSKGEKRPEEHVCSCEHYIITHIYIYIIFYIIVFYSILLHYYIYIGFIIYLSICRSIYRSM